MASWIPPRTYGWRRIQPELADAYGQKVNKKLIRSNMAAQGISGLPARRKAKPSPAHRATTEDLVQRLFARNGPNQLWMTDITERPTREGKLYCCVVLDSWSRRVVGWSLDAGPRQRWSTRRSGWPSRHACPVPAR